MSASCSCARLDWRSTPTPIVKCPVREGSPIPCRGCVMILFLPSQIDRHKETILTSTSVSLSSMKRREDLYGMPPTVLVMSIFCSENARWHWSPCHPSVSLASVESPSSCNHSSAFRSIVFILTPPHRQESISRDRSRLVAWESEGLRASRFPRDQTSGCRCTDQWQESIESSFRSINDENSEVKSNWIVHLTWLVCLQNHHLSISAGEKHVYRYIPILLLGGFSVQVRRSVHLESNDTAASVFVPLPFFLVFSLSNRSFCMSLKWFGSDSTSLSLSSFERWTWPRPVNELGHLTSVLSSFEQVRAVEDLNSPSKSTRSILMEGEERRADQSHELERWKWMESSEKRFLSTA